MHLESAHTMRYNQKHIDTKVEGEIGLDRETDGQTEKKEEE